MIRTVELINEYVSELNIVGLSSSSSFFPIPFKPLKVSGPILQQRWLVFFKCRGAGHPER